MSPKVIEFRHAARQRVLVAHRRGEVRHALRTLIETADIAVIEAADGDAALAELERGRFDLLVLELDLPMRDGVALMQLHRVLLAHEHARVHPHDDAPAVVLTLAREVAGNATLTDHLRTLGVAGFIDDDPKPQAASVIEEILRSRAMRIDAGKPAVA
ncbi:MAG TPA: response regulator [Casimicrobiaceae bacterium]|nr:response regulator [Casimicrobiaceae bacterium]